MNLISKKNNILKIIFKKSKYMKKIIKFFRFLYKICYQGSSYINENRNRPQKII